MILLTKDQITTILPQRHPFVMIDALLYDDLTLTKTSFTILPENVLIENGKATAALLIENIAQTAAAGAGYKALEGNGPVRIGYIGAIKNLQVNRLPEVGATLTTTATQVNAVFNVNIVEGKVYEGEELVASCEIKIFLQETTP